MSSRHNVDFTSGWLVANIGHDNRRVMRAVRKARGWAVIDGYKNPMRAKAEAAMLSILPPYLDHIAFYNSGSEAIDAAIRLAGGSVVAQPRAFHGSTIAAQAIPRADFTKKILNKPVLVETFLGPWCEWHSPDVIDNLRGHTLIFDEMQAGFGRTGRWWGFEHYDIEPDIVVGGKAMAGGFPMAFVAGRASLMAGQLTYESTFSGNSLCAAACVATIKEIRRLGLVDRAVEIGQQIKKVFPLAIGKGAAYAFPHPDADGVVDRARGQGVRLLRTGRGTVKMSPPLTISKRDLMYGLSVIRDVR